MHTIELIKGALFPRFSLTSTQIQEQLGETPEVRTAALAALREKIAQLPQADRIENTSDNHMIRFLRARKFDIDEALQRTVDYARFYGKWGKHLEGMSADEFLIHKDFLMVLQGRDREGRVMIVMQPKKGIGVFTKEFVKENPFGMLRFNVWMFERLSHNPDVQVSVCLDLMLEHCSMIVALHGYCINQFWLFF